MRIFICSNRKNLGSVGGGGGVNYRLSYVNSLSDSDIEVINVFSDAIVTKNNFSVMEVNKVTKKNTLKSKMRSIINKSPHFISFFYKNKVRKAKRYLKSADEKYLFTNEDVFYLHDLESAIAFKELFDYSNTVLVYHHQGSVYNEWSSDTGIKSDNVRRFLNKYLRKAFKGVNYWGFPSKGARESLMLSEPSLKDFISLHEFDVFYNGMNCNVSGESQDEKIKNICERLNSFSGYTFVTVSTLNEAKGVERIPCFLSKLKKRKIAFKWVLVGNGVKYDEVKESISNQDIEANTIWLQTRVDHDDILRIMKQCQFYIMFHRFSIFDFATVEAMSCGCIPILSNVGGNREVVFGDSGLLIDDVSSIEPFINYIDFQELKSKEKLNMELQNKYFSEKQFFNYYLSFARKLENNNNKVNK